MSSVNHTPKQKKNLHGYVSTAQGILVPQHKQPKPKKKRQFKAGFADKTLWDWLSLLFVPLLIGIGTTVVTYYQIVANENINATNIEIARQARLDDILKQYRDDISALVFERGLTNPKVSTDVREVASSLTLNTLERLDASRCRSLIIFLTHLNLVQGYHPEPNILPGLPGPGDLHAHDRTSNEITIIELANAQLARVQLADIDLRGANLSGADLEGTDLTGTDLQRANLVGANLRGANLSGADLYQADLDGANLSKADLRGAKLTKEQLASTHRLDMARLTEILRCADINYSVYNLQEQEEQVKQNCIASLLAGY